MQVKNILMRQCRGRENVPATAQEKQHRPQSECTMVGLAAMEVLVLEFGKERIQRQEL